MAIEYKDSVTKLLELFPEYEITDKENIELPYVIYADFAQFNLERLENNVEQEFVEKTFKFINHEFEDSNADAEFLNLLQVELFENFAQSKTAINYCRSNLNSNARLWFEKTLQYTGLAEPDLRIIESESDPTR